jgi:sec-independent protein translocase protein TatA
MTTTFFLAGIMGLGGPEMAFIFILLLLLFGAKKLPELARGMGKSLGEFKKARQEFEEEIQKGGDDINRSTAVTEPAGKQQFPN